jgi:ABC-type antimicrobial peptide transport system permease subunit
MAIPFVAGRDVTDEESFSGAPVGVLNETAARLLCGDVTSCLGRTIATPDQPARTIVGIVRDSRQTLQRAAVPALYAPPQNDFALKTLVIDADGSRASREGVIRALSVSRDARVNLTSLDEGRDREISPFRFNAVVIGGFAALTLILAVVGVGGVMAATVGERTREFGIRLALGATSARVRRLVLRHAAVPVAIGSICGLAGAALTARLVASLLYGVRPLDTPSFVFSLAVMAGAGVAAAWPSARRAGRVDPIVCLRAE